MAERDPYITKMEAKLEEMDAELQKLKAKAKGKGAEAEMQFNDLVAEYEQKKAVVEKDVAELRSSGESAAKDLKEGADRALGELTAAYEKAKSRFS